MWAAAFGALCLGAATYIWSAWLLSGNAKPTPTGITRVPGWMSIALHAQEILMGLGALVAVYLVLVRPWRREGRITFDGLLVICFLLVVWQDPLFNYAQLHFTYSSVFINFGSWSANIPGFLPPNGDLFPEPVVWIVAAYSLFIVFVLVNCAVMRKATSRWPRVRGGWLVLICFGVSITVCFVAEPIWMRTGAYTYGGALKGWTLFYGKYYQYPLYEPILASTLFTSLSCLRYFRDDRGRTFVEHGIDSLRVSGGLKSILRFLALFGAVNACYLAFYNVPQQWFNLHSSPWPKAIAERSYWTNGLCGEGTGYACGGPAIPIPRRGSAHVNPAGELVYPNGTSRPVPIPLKK